jgi:hypothetical protein
LRPLRDFFRAIVFFLRLVVVFFFPKISSNLSLYALSAIPVVIGLFGYNFESGVRTDVFRRNFLRRRRGFSKRSCFIHFS